MKIQIVGPVGSPHVHAWSQAFSSRGHDVENVSVPLPGRSGVARTVVASLGAVFSSFFKRPEVRIVHSLGTHGALSLFLRPVRSTVVVPWGTEVHRAATSNYRGKVAEILLKRASLILVTSNSMKQLIRNRWSCPPAMISVISWGVEDLFIRFGESRIQKAVDLKSDSRSTGRPIRILAPRGVTETYGFGLLLEGLELAVSRGIDVQLTAINTSSLDMSELDGVPYIDAIDPVGKFELARLYLETDLVVSIPGADQRSTTVLEALATGVPILLSDIPAYRELRRDGFEIALLESRDAEGVYTAISKVGSGKFTVHQKNVALARKIEYGSSQMDTIVDTCTRLEYV